MLELLGLVLAAPGAIAALNELLTQHRIARAAARLRVTELDFSVRFSIRREVGRTALVDDEPASGAAALPIRPPQRSAAPPRRTLP